MAESVIDSSRRLYNAGSFVVENTTLSGDTTSGSIETASSSAQITSGSGTGTSGETSLTENVAITNGAVANEENSITEPKLITDGGDFSRQEVIKIAAPQDVRSVEIYARPLKSIQPLFLGAAVQGTTYWYFFFDTLQVPNGEYELLAKARSSNGLQTSQAVKVKIVNGISIPESITAEPVQTEVV